MKNPAFVILMLIGSALIFTPSSCSCGTCEREAWARVMLGVGCFVLAVRMGPGDAAHGIAEEVKPTVLDTCPHCGQKTLKSRPTCISCGQGIDRHVELEVAPVTLAFSDTKVDPPAEPKTVLRTCPHCGEKTLKSLPTCLTCGKE